MSRTIVFNSDQKKEIISLYVDEKKPCRYIANEIGVSVTTIQNRLRNWGIIDSNRRHNTVHYTKKDKERIVNLCRNRVSCAKIGDIYNVSEESIRRLLIKMDVPRGTHLTEKEKNNIISMYVNDNLSCLKIGNIVNLGHATIHNKLTEWGVDTSAPNYIVNDYFFDNLDNEYSCYWSGFILGDGSIFGDRVRIELHRKDRKHLQKFLDDLDSNYPIANRRKREISYIQITSKHMVDSLKKYGVVQNKIYIAKPVIADYPSLQKHVYRGLIDSDGSLGIYKGSPSITLSGTKDVCDGFREFCKILCNSKAKVHDIKNNKGFSFNIGGKYSIPVIRELYSDSNIYLDRKYKIAMRILNLEKYKNM